MVVLIKDLKIRSMREQYCLKNYSGKKNLVELTGN